MVKDIDQLSKEIEKQIDAEVPKSRVEELEKEVLSLRKTLEAYGIVEELHVSNIEYICQKEIANLKKLVENGALTQEDAKTLDILHKNLRMARGSLPKKQAPGKQASEAELLKLVTKNEQQ